ARARCDPFEPCVQPPCAAEAEVVVVQLEHANRVGRDAHGVVRRSRVRVEPDELLLNTRTRLEERIRRSSADCLVENLLRLAEPAGLEERLAELGQEPRRLVARKERPRPLEERDRRRQIAACEGLPPGRAEEPTRLPPELRVRTPEVAAKPEHLLEVVADDGVVCALVFEQ